MCSAASAQRGGRLHRAITELERASSFKYRYGYLFHWPSPVCVNVPGFCAGNLFRLIV
jgi:hypothetical protein